MNQLALGNRFSGLALCVFAVGASSFLSGCSKSEDRLPVYPATGIVRMDGEPFGPCIVEMAPSGDGATRTVMGTADATGKITFGTYGIDDGAAAGSFKVLIRSSISAPPPKPIPAKYGSDRTTPLTARITETGPNEVALDLDSKGAKGKSADPFSEAYKSEAFSAGAPAPQ